MARKLAARGRWADIHAREHERVWDYREDKPRLIGLHSGADVSQSCHDHAARSDALETGAGSLNGTGIAETCVGGMSWSDDGAWILSGLCERCFCGSRAALLLPMLLLLVQQSEQQLSAAEAQGLLVVAVICSVIQK